MYIISTLERLVSVIFSVIAPVIVDPLTIVIVPEAINGAIVSTVNVSIPDLFPAGSIE